MNRRGVVTMVLLGACGIAGLAVACTDDNLSPTKATLAVGGTSGYSRIPGRARVTPAEFDRRNPMHWVGVAHNQGVDYLRAEMRAGRLHLKDVCRDAPIVLARRQAVAGHASAPDPELVKYGRAYLASVEACRTGTIALGPTSPLVMLARPASVTLPPQAYDDSIIANTLLQGIATVTQNAVSSVALAPKLDSIAALSDNLDSTAQSVVYGTAAVAMSSMEYWEDNLEDLTYEVERDYCDTEAPDRNSGPCLEIPYSLVAPAGLATMLRPTDWSVVGKIAGADVLAVIGGGYVGLIMKAMFWEKTLLAAAGTSFATGCAIIYKTLKERI